MIAESPFSIAHALGALFLTPLLIAMRGALLRETISELRGQRARPAYRACVRVAAEAASVGAAFGLGTSSAAAALIGATVALPFSIQRVLGVPFTEAIWATVWVDLLSAFIFQLPWVGLWLVGKGPATALTLLLLATLVALVALDRRRRSRGLHLRLSAVP